MRARQSRAAASSPGGSPRPRASLLEALGTTLAQCAPPLTQRPHPLMARQQHDPPACRSTSSRSGMLISSSTVTGRFTCPLMQKSLVPCTSSGGASGQAQACLDSATRSSRLSALGAPCSLRAGDRRPTGARCAGQCTQTRALPFPARRHAPRCSCAQTTRTRRGPAGGWWASRPPLHRTGAREQRARSVSPVRMRGGAWRRGDGARPGGCLTSCSAPLTHSPRWSRWWGSRRGPRWRGRAA